MVAQYLSLLPSAANRFKNIEAGECRGYHKTWHLGVPVDLFDLLLTFVHEEKLLWDFLQVRVFQ